MRKSDTDADVPPEGAVVRSATVQSVERAIDLLEAMAEAGGTAGLSHLAATSGLPLPTIHRLVRTLAGRGYVRQESSREYALGPRLVRLGDTAGRLVGVWARPQLASLVDTLGESANLALMEGSQVVYVAQAPGRHSMRMFTEVGRRVSPHCTAVGKALLSRMSPDRVAEILRHTDMVSHTENTITDRAAYERELDRVRAAGFAIDEGEQEIGVRCVAVALDGPLPAAVSISGPTTRMTDALVESAVPQLRAAADALVAELARQDTTAGA
ncbi:IclR family transcriptional regulator [Pseudonocardia sediminis]|uniref:Glycerol operon regulatory protein n=1 Tax=Pseudonocardia sediminis TaxID=1397368 RepID=A0A4Q7V013_PSEST|nr:IclR family transcriptional regulator [Pseudonocardia sediminis]RZT86738.1 IclR family transcriptional regulator [Pseudonocardia sediminis]